VYIEKKGRRKERKLINETGNTRGEKKAISSLLLCAAPVSFSPYWNEVPYRTLHSTRLANES
jgi:hypothetical protein